MTMCFSIVHSCAYMLWAYYFVISTVWQLEERDRLKLSPRLPIDSVPIFPCLRMIRCRNVWGYARILEKPGASLALNPVRISQSDEPLQGITRI